MKALVNLIKEYKTITLEQLEGCFDEDHTHGSDVMESITGFGSVKTCSICEDAREKARNKGIVVDNNDYYCKHCIYRQLFPDSGSRDLYCLDDTYHDVSDARSPEELYTALQNRITLLEDLICNENIGKERMDSESEC